MIKFQVEIPKNANCTCKHAMVSVIHIPLYVYTSIPEVIENLFLLKQNDENHVTFRLNRMIFF